MVGTAGDGVKYLSCSIVLIFRSRASMPYCICCACQNTSSHLLGHLQLLTRRPARQQAAAVQASRVAYVGYDVLKENIEYACCCTYNHCPQGPARQQAAAAASSSSCNLVLLPSLITISSSSWWWQQQQAAQ
jgi:hypothetical protein